MSGSGKHRNNCSDAKVPCSEPLCHHSMTHIMYVYIYNSYFVNKIVCILQFLFVGVSGSSRGSYPTQR